MVARDAACVNLYQIQVQPMLPSEVNNSEDKFALSHVGDKTDCIF